jgi:hypothetical protein
MSFWHSTPEPSSSTFYLVSATTTLLLSHKCTMGLGHVSLPPFPHPLCSATQIQLVYMCSCVRGVRQVLPQEAFVRQVEFAVGERSILAVRFGVQNCDADCATADNCNSAATDNAMRHSIWYGQASGSSYSPLNKTVCFTPRFHREFCGAVCNTFEEVEQELRAQLRARREREKKCGEGQGRRHRSSGEQAHAFVTNIEDEPHCVCHVRVVIRYTSVMNVCSVSGLHLEHQTAYIMCIRSDMICYCDSMCECEMLARTRCRGCGVQGSHSARCAQKQNALLSCKNGQCPLKVIPCIPLPASHSPQLCSPSCMSCHECKREVDDNYARCRSPQIC